MIWAMAVNIEGHKQVGFGLNKPRWQIEAIGSPSIAMIALRREVTIGRKAPTPCRFGAKTQSHGR